MSLNQVNLTGRLVADPVSKVAKTKAGESTVCQFSIANDKRGKDAGTNFVDCVAWGATADAIVKFFKKGNPIFIAGRLDQSSWEKDGQKHTKIQIIVDNFEFMAAKSESTEKADNNDNQISLDDIPFNYEP